MDAAKAVTISCSLEMRFTISKFLCLEVAWARVRSRRYSIAALVTIFASNTGSRYSDIVDQLCIILLGSNGTSLVCLHQMVS